jgi:hypothetical protein
MKQVRQFNEFISNTVNLNQSRINTLTARVDTIDRYLKDDAVFGELYVETALQGSYAHRTIIKPSPKSPEFDADLMLYLNEKEDWEPKDYIEELYRRFRENTNYKNIVGRRTRCVTLDYAGEFHLDIVPCIKRDGFWNGETFHVCNRSENIEEKTDPQGYTEWLKDKNTEVGNNNLVKAIRLIKYLRDIKQTFSCKSILLTTLIAKQVGTFGDLFEEYDDFPTTLKIVVNNLNAYLQDNEVMPIVSNPVNEDENFNRHWSQEKYTNFRVQIKRYNDWINDAFAEVSQEESIKKWQKIFGDDFGKQVSSTVTKQSQTNSGINNFPIPMHVEKPRWPILGTANLSVSVTIHKANDGSPAIVSLQREIIGNPIKKHLKVRMEYLGGISQGYDLYWQVVNTGQDALQHNCSRGDIFYGDKVRWEDSLYEGTHWIECFIVDRKKNICTGRSGRYFVTIG